MGKKKLIYYWADYCPYCHEYWPEWNKLKIKLKECNIETIEYEKQTDWNIVKNENIETFPTLKYVDENGNKTKLKKRDTDYVLKFINKRTNIKKLKNKKTKKQKGGGNDYFYKYLKYKNKYLNLKKLI